MNIETLIEALKEYPKDMQVFISSDSELNSVQKIMRLEHWEFIKSNNNGTYSALVVIPSGEEVQGSI